MPLTPINIASKMKGMKKAYFHSIGSNVLEIPNCVRPFLKQMKKICGASEEANQSYSYAEALDEELSDCGKVLQIYDLIVRSAIILPTRLFHVGRCWHCNR